MPVAIVWFTSVNPDPETRLPSMVNHRMLTAAPGGTPAPVAVTGGSGGPWVGVGGGGGEGGAPWKPNIVVTPSPVFGGEPAPSEALMYTWRSARRGSASLTTYSADQFSVAALCTRVSVATVVANWLDVALKAPYPSTAVTCPPLVAFSGPGNARLWALWDS